MFPSEPNAVASAPSYCVTAHGNRAGWREGDLIAWEADSYSYGKDSSAC